MFGAPSIVPEVGRGAMTSPAGIPNFLVEGSSIAQSAVGVKGLGQTPPAYRGQVFEPLGRLQLQILSREVTGCNPHRSLGKSLEPERERVGDRHEATRKGIRDPPFRDPGLPVEFEAGPDSPEILGRGL